MELAIAMRAGIGSTVGSLGPIYEFCLQGVLVFLLLVVNAGAAASRRRENALCEAEQCASGNLASDLQDALADGTGRCPITHQLMRDPVRTCEWSASRPGCHVYEREDIVKWLRIKRTSPWTNLPLEDITLEPCHLTRDLVERLLAAQPVASPPNCYLDRALELAAKCAAAVGSILLSHSLRNIGIDADVVCNRGGTEGGPAMFEWTGTRSLWSRSGCAIHAPAVRPVFELLPGVKPLAFVRGHDGQLSSTWWCKCCNQCTPRGGRRPIRHRVADICRPHYASRRHRASRQGVATGRADLLGHEDRVARMARTMANVGRSMLPCEATRSESGFQSSFVLRAFAGPFVGVFLIQYGRSGH